MRTKMVGETVKMRIEDSANMHLGTELKGTSWLAVKVHARRYLVMGSMANRPDVKYQFPIFESDVDEGYVTILMSDAEVENE